MAGDESASPDPSSYDAQDGTPNTKTPKDRRCPFCNIPFTSSSLGRHLDLYIKEKNPKPADGLHDVVKIRQMRGKITRRHPKGSSRSQNPGGHEPARNPSVSLHGPTESNVRATRDHAEGLSPFETPFADTVSGTHLNDPTNPRMRLHRLNWQATGVINDLPAAGDRPSQGLAGSDRPAPRACEEAEESGANMSEVVLRDVLGNVQRAAARLQRPGPFETDLLSLNFPALCLKLLPTPPTLFSTTPLHSNTSWPINPPSEPHLDLVKNAIKRRIRGFMRVCPPLNIRVCTTQEECARHIENAVEEEFAKYQDHANCLHSQWQELSDDQRQQVWHLEVMRALAKTFDDLTVMSSKYARAQDEIEELKAENEKLWAIRQGGSAAAERLSRAPFVSQALVKELGNIDSDPSAWGYQVVVDRYRDILPGSFEEPSRAAPSNGRPIHGRRPEFLSTLTEDNFHTSMRGGESKSRSLDVEMTDENQRRSTSAG